MQSYELKTASYQGPIEKLLELIETRELAVTEISLGQVTDDFLKYLEGVNAEYQAQAGRGAAAESYMRLLADFIVIASRLIFIKSKSLIPDIRLSEDEERQIKDLEERVRLYQRLKPAIAVIAERWRKGNHEFSRPYFLHVRGLLLAIRAQQGEHGAFFYPAHTALPQLAGALRTILALNQSAVAEEEMVQEKITTLEQKIEEIFAHMKHIKEASFRGLAKGASKVEAIVAFLAILHLAREQMVLLTQESRDSDIIIRNLGQA